MQLLEQLGTISFEIGSGCNYAHSFCPITDPLRYPPEELATPLDKTVVGDFLKAARENGFKGHVGWNIYCEPLLYAERMADWISFILVSSPDTKFSLLTNGRLLDFKHKSLLQKFNKICITLYSRDDEKRVIPLLESGLLEGVSEVVLGYTWLSEYLLRHPSNIGTFLTSPDERIRVYDVPPSQIYTPCARPMHDMEINYYGNVRMCCIDYRGSMKIGNICRDPAQIVIESFIKTAQEAAKGTPPICSKCKSLWSNCAM